MNPRVEGNETISDYTTPDLFKHFKEGDLSFEIYSALKFKVDMNHQCLTTFDLKDTIHRVLYKFQKATAAILSQMLDQNLSHFLMSY